ncbi:hypothetical protein IFM89_019170, partial [Coptis chinensis]
GGGVVGYMESGRQWRAKDIGLTDRKCAWMPHGFMSMDTKLGAGKAFLRSLCHQNAEWGVDFGLHAHYISLWLLESYEIMYIDLWARDFSAPNMIGTEGLKGNSWPDLDMLPLGWLIDP